MSNSFFQFKQFTIHQSNCAMKVCTDACLFGALAVNAQRTAVNVLDIGTGTGLLSLMYAQKNPYAIIDALEIDAAAALQAKENFAASPWKERLSGIHADILGFKSDKKYELVISNPPFFENDLKSDDKSKNTAKHDASLSLEGLLKAIDNNTSPDGSFVILLPYHRVSYFENEALQLNFHLKQKFLIRQTPKHEFFRGILFFSREKAQLQITEMAIRRSEEVYSDEFIVLLKDYYLNL